MSGVRGVLAGSLGLITLQAVLSSNSSAARTGQLATGIAGLVAHAVSPAVPLIPDLTAKKAGAKPSSSTGTATIAPSQFSLNPRQVPAPQPATTPSPVIAGTAT